MERNDDYQLAVDSYDLLKSFLLDNENNIKQLKPYWSLYGGDKVDNDMILDNKDISFDEVCDLYKDNHKSKSMEELYLDEINIEISRIIKKYGDDMMWKTVKGLRSGEKFNASDYITCLIDIIYDYLNKYERNEKNEKNETNGFMKIMNMMNIM